MTSTYPVFEKKGSGYVYIDDWNGHIIEAQIKYVQSDRGRLSAQVAITMDREPLFRTNPTLTSVDGVDKLWRKLNRRRHFDDYGVDWELWVESLAGRVLDSFREFTPSVALKDVPAPDEISYLVHPFIIENEVNILFGDGGNGKSMLSLLWATLCDSGHIDSDHRVVTKPARVLYLDYETDEQQVRRRASWLHKGMGIEDVESNILYKHCIHPFEVMADSIKDEVEREGVDLIIIDSLGLALGGSLEDSESVTSFFSTLRWVGKTSLTITHVNKAGIIHGSIFTQNSARQSWECKRKATKKDVIQVGIFHRKQNDVGKMADRTYELRFAPGEVKVVGMDTMDTEVGREELSWSQLTYEVVKLEGPTARDLVPGLVAEFREVEPDKIKGAVRSAISRYLREGKFVESGDKIMLPNAAVPVAETEPEKEGDPWTL